MSSMTLKTNKLINLKVLKNYVQTFSSKCSTIPVEYNTLIGLEVHIQINASSKLFSRSCKMYTAAPNTNVSLFDASIPGSLPVINRYCVESVIKTGLALNCRINEKCAFDRKHYFYHDSPSGFQITQKREPIASDGYISFVLPKSKNKDSEIKTVRLKQIQLEQDTGKTLKDLKSGKVFVDLNRCGVGLMECVFEPELTNHLEAYHLIKELIHILRRIDTSSCKMEEGALRIDANVSVSPFDGPAGNRIELKNLNSLFSVTKGLEVEINRHTEALKMGLLVPSETRFYDPVRKKTFPMREKDNTEDYRYMPEPNLPPLNLMDDPELSDDQLISLSSIKESMPSLPEGERKFLIDSFKLTIETAALIVENDLFSFFCSIIHLNPDYPVSKIASFIARDLPAILNDNQINIEEANLSPKFILDAFELAEKDVITMNIVQDIIQLAIDGDKRGAREIVKEHGWRLTHNEQLITQNCLKIVDANPISAFNAKRGNHYSLDWLTEQVLNSTDTKSTRNVVRSYIKLILEGREMKEMKKAAIKAGKKLKEE